MKKTLVSVCMAGTLAIFTACHTSKEVATLASLNGTWTLEEINGAAVVSNQEDTPFIAFDTENGKISGFSGCNRIMGSFETNSKPGIIALSNIGSTRMACPDMTTERNMLNTLGQVKKYMITKEGTVALCNETNRPIMILKKKEATNPIADLNGEWNITTINGETISDSLENKPFIGFNIAENRIYGNAGCNNFNGGYNTAEENPSSIAFPAVATTMMACPNMDTESKILQALNNTRSFGKLENGEFGLYDADNNLLMTLQKK